MIVRCNTLSVNIYLVFWKTIGKIGVGQNRKRPIPMEGVLDDGSMSNDTQNVLNKWKTDFSSLFNVEIPVSDCLHSTSDNISSTVPTDPLFNEHTSISLFEVTKGRAECKAGKSMWF